MRRSLGFAVPEDDITLEPRESDPVIKSFAVVGETLMNSYTLGKSRRTYPARAIRRLNCRQEQRDRLLRQIELFLEMSAVEQSVALGDSLPSVEQYRRRRMGTSAVGVCLAITESVFLV